MEGGILVAGKADEADLALLLRAIEGLEHATLGVRQLGIVVVDDAVDLPHVQVIGLQPPQRLLEHRKGEPPRLRPCVQTLVIRTTLSRRPRSARPSRFSVLPL